jgi:hypothetical protein
MKHPSLAFSSGRRRFTVAAAAGTGLALAFAAAGARAQVTSLNDAINKAGRQRMLSQRMAKAWLAIGQGLDVQRAQRILSDSMALFDRQFFELKAFAPTPSIRATYAALDPVWSEYKMALVGAAPGRNTAPSLVVLDSRVLQLAHQGTVQLEAESGQAVGRLVNIAGRQRMLSQRMAKFYLALSWKAEVAEARRELDIARGEFTQALATLYDAPQATVQIRQELDLARQQWVFFENALQSAAEGSLAAQRATQVFSTSENILEVMDRVTGHYTRLAA